MKYIFTLLSFLYITFGLAQNTKQYDIWEENLTTGYEYVNQQQYIDAQDHLLKAYNIAKIIFDKNSEELNTSAYYYGLTQFVLKYYENAIEPLEIATNGFKELLGRNSIKYSTSLSYLSSVYLETERYDKAEACLIESTETSKETFGEDNANYGVSLTNLAGYYVDIGNFNKALEVLNKGLEILKDNPEFPEEYYNNLRANYLPSIYKNLGRLEDALEIEKQSLNNIEENDGKITPNYANILTSIASIYNDLGQFKKAEKAFINAIEIFEIINLEDNNEALGNTHMGLVICYTSISDFENALIHAYKAIKLTKLESEKLPKNKISYYNILGNLFYELGQYEIAQKFLEDAVNETIKTIGNNAPQLPVYKSNLGRILWLIDNKEAAKTKLYEALELAKSLNYTVNDNVYRICIRNLTPLLIDEKKYEEAIKIEEKNIALGNKLLPYYWNDSTNLADLYLMNNQCDKALNLLNTLLQPIETFYSKKHPNYIRVLNAIILAKNCNKKYGGLINTIEEANNLTKTQIQREFSFSPKDQKEVFLNQLKDAFDIYQSVNYNIPQNAELTILNLENQLMLKGLLLNTSIDIILKLSESNSPEIIQIINDYTDSKQRLTKLQNESKNYDNDSIKVLQSKVFNLEVDLVKKYTNVSKKPFNFNKSWKKIKATLKTNEVAIEFSRFKYYDYSETDKTYYAAYIIKHNSEIPQIIKLFEEKELLSLFKISDQPNDLYTSRGSKALRIKSVNQSEVIYNLVWGPLESYLNNIETVYFSPVGLLNKIAFGALKNGENLLINKYKLNQLSSTYKIVTKQELVTPNNTLFLGGITYNYSNKGDTISDNNTKNNSDLMSLNLNRKNDNHSWSYLPGTLTEVDNIQNLFNTSKIPHKKLTGSAATETAFKALSGNSPQIIHIATHGFFFEQNKVNTKSLLPIRKPYISDANPLKRSGLLFAGANYAWQNGNNPNEIDNGILTANEIANLDLSNTKMVVLSACETGLGDIEGSEGVYGLQRAFKMAGVNLIMMSLWEVPDAETAEFMNLFYTNWLSGQKVRKAFKNTQLTMSETYKNNPEKWAAFVLFE